MSKLIVPVAAVADTVAGSSMLTVFIATVLVVPLNVWVALKVVATVGAT